MQLLVGRGARVAVAVAVVVADAVVVFAAAVGVAVLVAGTVAVLSRWYCLYGSFTVHEFETGIGEGPSSAPPPPAFLPPSLTVLPRPRSSRAFSIMRSAMDTLEAGLSPTFAPDEVLGRSSWRRGSGRNGGSSGRHGKDIGGSGGLVAIIVARSSRSAERRAFRGGGRVRLVVDHWLGSEDKVGLCLMALSAWNITSLHGSTGLVGIVVFAGSASLCWALGCARYAEGGEGLERERARGDYQSAPST